MQEICGLCGDVVEVEDPHLPGAGPSQRPGPIRLTGGGSRGFPELLVWALLLRWQFHCCGAHCGGVEAGELSHTPQVRPLAEEVTKFSWISESGL